MTTQEHSNYTVVFRTTAESAPDLYVRQMDGHEGLSQLYAFDLIVETSTGGPLAFDVIEELLVKDAWLAFGENEEHKVHGVIREVEMLNMNEPSPVLYHLRLVPKFFDTTLTAGSWVYQELSAPQVIKDVLTEAGFHDGDDYELRLSKTYKPYEYKVQYEETDFQFLSRVMEYEGIFYFFEHGDDGSKLVIADGNNNFVELEGFESLTYDPRGGTAGGEHRISALTRTRRTVTTRVSVRDYNYRTPSTELVGKEDVDPAGVGEHVYYGEHFKDPAGGTRIAKLRAQELFAHRETYAGSTSVRGLHPGHKFAVENHYFDAMDQQYVVTDIRHSVQQAGIDAGSSSRAYQNEFTAIPYAVPWRPVRMTPIPRIAGVIHGKIDAGSDGVRATPLDEHGRYKVILPWDLAGKAGGKASRWIRMAQPASGGGYGVQFPLHIGTEVAIIHVNGDPDRPLIMSSVPNFETASPVNSGNPTQSQIRTRHGITVTFDDQS